MKSGVPTSDGVKVVFETPDGKELTTDVDYVLVSVGRKPNSTGLGLEIVGVKSIRKDLSKQTNNSELPCLMFLQSEMWLGGPLLAHKATKEGIIAAEVIAGLNDSFDNIAMPSAIFTDPEIAVVGMTSAEATSKGIQTKTGKFPFIANGKALASSETDGFTKIIAEKESGRVLGVGIVGLEASDLISEATLAIEMGATLEDIALTIHPHPTLPETIMEAAENALGRAIHIQNRPVS